MTQPAPESAEATNAQGQWVYTQQYGWVWMPYGSQYTYAPTQAGVYPSEYVYYPSYGWTWIAAPWVFGWGVSPYFGVYGPSHFGWYHHWVGVGHGYHPGYGRTATIRGTGGTADTAIDRRRLTADTTPVPSRRTRVLEHRFAFMGLPVGGHPTFHGQPGGFYGGHPGGGFHGGFGGGGFHGGFGGGHGGGGHR